MCERTWFYFGDHEREIQGRMTILRDYMPEIRDNLEKNRRKFKPLVYQPLDDDEMEVIQASIRKHRKKGDHYAEIIDKCMAEWEQEFAQERIEAGPPSDELLHRTGGSAESANLGTISRRSGSRRVCCPHKILHQQAWQPQSDSETHSDAYSVE